MIGIATDLAIAALVLGVALWSLLVRDAVSSVIAFIVYGLLLSLVWVRLAAVDVAMTEAAIGGGAAGILILRAATRLRPAPSSAGPSWTIRILAIAASAGVGLALSRLVLDPVHPAPTLAPAAIAHLPAFGLGNGVTAVLMGYRGLDTLLEKVVLAVALVAVWSLAPDRSWGGRPGLPRPLDSDGVLVLLARVLPPVGILVGIYLVWAGADAPGGAFQGGTVIAAMWVLTIQVGLVQPPATRSRGLRLALVAGAGLFILVGLTGMLLGASFLTYPASHAKLLIIVIEVAMTLSIAATIALMVVGPPGREPER
jgi:multisubunit Na+/H+ antiporter MnhB subunit